MNSSDQTSNSETDETNRAGSYPPSENNPTPLERMTTSERKQMILNRLEQMVLARYKWDATELVAEIEQLTAKWWPRFEASRRD